MLPYRLINLLSETASDVFTSELETTQFNYLSIIIFVVQYVLSIILLYMSIDCGQKPDR